MSQAAVAFWTPRDVAVERTVRVSCLLVKTLLSPLFQSGMLSMLRHHTGSGEGRDVLLVSMAS